MATTSSVSSLRLSGLSSGIDTESVVKNMLQSMQTKVDKQNQTKTKLGWKADALREINSLIKSFRESNMSVLSPGSNMMSPSTYNAFSVSMLTSTAAVTVSAGSSASAGKMTINSISQLATSAAVKSTGIFAGSSMNTGTKLADLELTNALEFEDGEISFSINGKAFTFTEDTTLSAMMSTINSSDAGVKMSYSSLTKGFSITSKSTGSSSTVEIANIKGNAFAGESEEAADSAFGIAAGTAAGQDAKLRIEGVDVVRPSNTFTIDGITYTLNNESASEIGFNVSQDLDSTVKKITSFINSYNELISKLQNKIEEKTFRAYSPLTADQKSALKDSEITMWEDKAKSGLLKNDSSISSLLTTIRSAFYTAVEGAGLSAAEIGLTTGTYSDGGKITVNETKLRAALQNNPDAVANLFTARPTSTDAKTAFGQSGLVVRISDALLKYTSSVTNNTLSSLQKQISDSEKMESSLVSKLSVKEQSLYKRFTAMEKALSSMNSQSGWLASLFTSS